MTDQWTPIGGGIFQLFQGAKPTPLTAFMDRSLPPAAQLDQLEAAMSWLPEQIVVAAAEEITGANYQLPAAIGPVAVGRIFAPTPAKIAVLIAPGDAEGPHPLRPYLWPTIDAHGDLVLDADETLIYRERIKTPPFMHYGENTYAHCTSHRVAIIGRLALPANVRSDYHIGLGLVSPTLMEGFAAVKALGRIGQNKSRYWVHHVRYEWLKTVTCRTTIRTKKKMFGGAGPTKVSKQFLGELRYPNGQIVDLDLWRFEGDEQDTAQKATAFQQQLEKACRSLCLTWKETDNSIRHLVDGTEAKRVWLLDEVGAYSFPTGLVSAR